MNPNTETPIKPASDLAAFNAACTEQRQPMAFHAQCVRCEERKTKGSPPKPFYEVEFADASGVVKLKAWSDAPAAAWAADAVEFFASLGGAAPQSYPCVKVAGTFSRGQWGIESNDWSVSPLSSAELDALFLGSPEVREKQKRDYDTIVEMIQGMKDLHFQTLCVRFLTVHGQDFRRAAAARNNHHARPGGLVEHVAGMMCSASALAAAYSAYGIPVNRDLLLAGVLFHDSGKLWENQYTPDSFAMPFTEAGELLGHIAMGFELVRNLWQQCEDIDRRIGDAWPGEKLLHLQHLILSHHGQKDFGSPTEPRTCEAMMLHYVDLLDARMEMLRAGFATAKRVAPTITERVWPLGVSLVEGLPSFVPAP